MTSATACSLPLAVHLRAQLAVPLQQAGFRLGEPGPSIEEVWVLQCHWKRTGERLSVTFVAARWQQGKRIGERIAFLVRVNHDAYVYLFDLDSQGAATLLYPAFDVAAAALPAGRPLLLPDDGLPYELEVIAPPGKDLVWVVASAMPLGIPRELHGDWAKASKLIPRMRRLGSPASAYAEAQLVLETTP